MEIKINTLSLFLILIVFIIAGFQGTESRQGRSLLKRDIDNSEKSDPEKVETKVIRNARGEKKATVIDDDSLRSFVLQYEKERKKELQRRNSEAEKGAEKGEEKVKRENSNVEVEEFEDQVLKFKLYQIKRKKRSPDSQVDNPENFRSQFQNKEALNLDFQTKLKALKNNDNQFNERNIEMSPDGTLLDGLESQRKYWGSFGDYTEGNPTNYLNVPFADNREGPILKIASHASIYPNTEDDLSRFKELENKKSAGLLDSTFHEKNDDTKKDREVNHNLRDFTDDQSKEKWLAYDPLQMSSPAQEDSDSESGEEDGTAKAYGIIKRKKRNAKKDESKEKTKDKGNNNILNKSNKTVDSKRKLKEKNVSNKEDNMECNLKEDDKDDKDDKRNKSKKGVKNKDKPKDYESTEAPNDIKEGTDYEESQVN